MAKKIKDIGLGNSPIQPGKIKKHADTVYPKLNSSITEKGFARGLENNGKLSRQPFQNKGKNPSRFDDKKLKKWQK